MGECGTASSPTFAAVCEAAGASNALFKLYVLPTMGFHTFLIATLMSLVNGLAMSTCHRCPQDRRIWPCRGLRAHRGFGEQAALVRCVEGQQSVLINCSDSGSLG